MPSNLTQWGALAAMLASVVWIGWTASGLVASLTPEGANPSGALGSPSSRLEPVVHAIALLGTLGGLASLRAAQATRHGWLGTIGFCAALVGLLLALANLAGNTMIEGDAFVRSSEIGFPGTLVGPTLAGAGFVLLGVSILRARVLPRWCALALIVAPPVSPFLAGSYGGGTVLGLVGITLGGVLWLQGGKATW